MDLFGDYCKRLLGYQLPLTEELVINTPHLPLLCNIIKYILIITNLEVSSYILDNFNELILYVVTRISLYSKIYFYINNENALVKVINIPCNNAEKLPVAIYS
jgi:hypothetical protein